MESEPFEFFEFFEFFLLLWSLGQAQPKVSGKMWVMRLNGFRTLIENMKNVW